MATFDENGNYVKTTWKGGDKITAAKLNKIEESLEAINNNDVSRHVEADSRLDKLESGTASDKQAINAKVDALEDVVEANKDAVDLDILSINSNIALLDKKVDDSVTEVEVIANTVDGKISQADASMKAQINQGKADMEAMVAEVEGELDALKDTDDAIYRKSMNIINVENYPTLEDALSVARENPYSTLYFPSDRTINETLNIPCKTNVKMDGCLIFDTTYDIPCMVIGNTDDRNTDVELSLRVKRKNTADWNTSLTNDVGIRIYNLWGSILNVIHCEQFHTGIQLIGHRQGFAHNIVNLTNIFLNRTHLELVAEEANGFVNENTFNGGRFTSNYGLSDYTELEKVGIKMTNAGGNNFNNNVFIRPCFQIGTNGYGIDWDNARMNTVISARVEESDYIARFNDACELNDIQIGYQTNLNIPYVDNSNAKTNYITHLRNIDKDKNNVLLANYDDLKNRYCRFSSSGPSYSLVSLSLGRFVSDGTIGHAKTGVDVEGEYLTLNGTVIGNKVDTSKVKSFKICKDTMEGFEGWVVVQCYDANGNILDNSSTRVFGSGKEGEQFTYASTMLGCYRTSSPSNEVSFTVSDEVNSIWFGVGTSTSNTAKVRSFAIYGQQYCSVYKGSANVKDYICAENTPVDAPVGSDRIIYKYGTITDYYGWIWNGTAWLKLMIGSSE